MASPLLYKDEEDAGLMVEPSIQLDVSGELPPCVFCRQLSRRRRPGANRFSVDYAISKKLTDNSAVCLEYGLYQRRKVVACC